MGRARATVLASPGANRGEDRLRSWDPMIAARGTFVLASATPRPCAARVGRSAGHAYRAGRSDALFVEHTTKQMRGKVTLIVQAHDQQFTRTRSPRKMTSSLASSVTSPCVVSMLLERLTVARWPATSIYAFPALVKLTLSRPRMDTLSASKESGPSTAIARPRAKCSFAPSRPTSMPTAARIKS